MLVYLVYLMSKINNMHKYLTQTYVDDLTCHCKDGRR